MSGPGCSTWHYYNFGCKSVLKYFKTHQVFYSKIYCGKWCSWENSKKIKLISLQPVTVEKYKIRDCCDLFLKVDVLLLSDIFESFRNK